MKLCRIGSPGKEKPAIIDRENNYRDLSSIINDFNPDTLNFDTIEKIKKTEISTLPKLDLNSRIGACVSNPSKFIGIGLNFKDHAEEQNLPIPKEPIIFSKFTSCITGPNDPIIVPKDSNHTDWEVELGFVMGKKAINVSVENAMDHVLGFFLVNDVSERDFQNLNMFLDVDGQRMQTGNTKHMIFDVKTLVSYMSSCMSLHPGDICCTGTPPGVGENMKPPHFLKGGEEVVLGVDKLGTQKHQVVPYKE